MASEAPHPYRHLPSDKNILRSLSDVRFLTKTLQNNLKLPTALDESFIERLQQHADFLRSLEARKDITWQIYAESDLGNFVKSIVTARANFDEDVGDTPPFSFCGRLLALQDHWAAQQRLEGNPLPWSPEFETATIPPVVDDPKFAVYTLSELGATPDQVAEADKDFENYKSEKGRIMSFCIRHLPHPDGVEPAPGVTKEEAMSSIMLGSRPDYTKIEGNKLWVPTYKPASDLAALGINVPHDWENPDDPALSADQKKMVEEKNAAALEKHLQWKANPSRLGIFSARQ